MKRNLNTIDKAIYILIYSVIPVISTMVVTLILLPFMDKIDNFDIAMTYISMISSFVVIPMIFLKVVGISFGKLDYKKYCFKTILVFVIGVILALAISYLKYNEMKRSIFVFSIQILPVAVSEEFWARVGFFRLLEKYKYNSLHIVLISSFVFGFVIHFNRPFVENLVFRFTGGLVLGILYLISKKIEVPILIHFLNNLLGGL